MAMTGTVKFFNGERGYGFIKPDDGGRDAEAHLRTSGRGARGARPKPLRAAADRSRG